MANASAPSGTARRPPNVVFILADDLGWRDTSLFGSPFYETPNVERLAARGMTFFQAYAANPLCSPTRASILTGLYPARIGITTPSGHVPEEILRPSLRPRGAPWQRALQATSGTRLALEYVTLAESLKAAGYATGHFGKWHLGREPYDALHQGFDVDVPHWYGPGPAGGYLAPWQFPHLEGRPGEHIEDRMAAEAVAFMRRHRDRPFFLNYWSFSVHGPWGGKPDLVERYRAKAAEFAPDSPQRNPVNGAMVHSLDDAVGALTREIDALGLADDTIIVFFSDNGGVHFREVAGAPVTSNLPLRGGKATIFEGGTREPLVVVWPGAVPPDTRSDAVVSSVDFYPTILEMVGISPRLAQRFDGISIVPALKGGTLARDAIYCHFPHYTPATGGRPATYVRRDNWKLIRFFADGDRQANRFELYDLAADLGETTNLAPRFPDLVAHLDGMIDAFLAETGAVIPIQNPGYDPAAVAPPQRVPADA
jgi:arylsulfatase A-like enzyme